MNKEKQIEEMANIMSDNEDTCKAMQCPNCKCEKYDHTICIHMLAADQLYNAGYRKASEVAREIFEEIEKIALHSITSFGLQTMVMGEVAFAELKKKYTESENDNGKK